MTPFSKITPTPSTILEIIANKDLFTTLDNRGLYKCSLEVQIFSLTYQVSFFSELSGKLIKGNKFG